jgi:hypothetical protein
VLSPEALLERCNQIRVAGGADPLKELIPGMPASPNSCLIARNLNFSCEVRGALITQGGPQRGVTVWGMFSDDPRLPQIAETLGLNFVAADTAPQGYRRLSALTAYRGAFIMLPNELGESALAFD